MKTLITVIILALAFTSCTNDAHLKNESPYNQTVVTTDIDNFWVAYDKITSTSDTVLQYAYLDSLYIQMGTPGLAAIREARNYTPQDFIDAINSYPQFWASIRQNTLEAEQSSTEMMKGIEQFSAIYPDLKPAKIYFTIGAFRTGGTTIDSLVLIGSEISMTDSKTVTSEFPEEWSHLKPHFATNPKDNLVFLNVHEYVHTQQNPRVFNMLSLAIYEGVAEFVASTALGVESPNPQIAFGQSNAERIREMFENEMFYFNNLYKWLDGNAPNEFGIRDLGYYVGFEICKKYYDQAKNKKAAIKTMIELDYTDEAEVDDFVMKSNYFSAPLDTLYQRFDAKRPEVVGIKPFENNSQNVSPDVKEITIEFSAPLNGYNTGVDFGDLGEDAFPYGPIEGRRWSEDNTSWTIPVDLEPNKTYQLFISNNFRTAEDIPLKALLIEFNTQARK